MEIDGWGKGLSGIVGKYDQRHKSRIESELNHPENKGNEIIKRGLKSEAQHLVIGKVPECKPSRFTFNYSLRNA